MCRQWWWWRRHSSDADDEGRVGSGVRGGDEKGVVEVGGNLQPGMAAKYGKLDWQAPKKTLKVTGSCLRPQGLCLMTTRHHLLAQ